MPRDRWIHGLTRDGGPAIHFVEHGSGEPVLLLHGFPDFWFMWRHQIPLLAQAGYRAIAVDMRGYNRSDAPDEIAAYDASHLAKDIIRVMDTLGISKAAIVGHDWGGVVAWHIAMNHPERITKLIVINAPHPKAYRRALMRSSQLLRSWYVLAFQIPRLPEMMLSASGMKWLRRIWRHAGARSGSVTDADMEKYTKSFSRKGKVRAALNYYRAAMRTMFTGSSQRFIEIPTLIIWGEKDKFLVSSLPAATRRWVPNLTIEKLAQYGHWPQLEAPEEVNALILQFLRAERT
jgi:pimeloyl-ACP methyl ester carboxylesterase